jgi:hypothetical protein
MIKMRSRTAPTGATIKMIIESPCEPELDVLGTCGVGDTVIDARANEVICRFDTALVTCADAVAA